MSLIQLSLQQDDQSRIVRHFHFTTWPDFGVPEPPVTLVKFVRAFRERVLPDSSKPIVVHCRYVLLSLSPTPRRLTLSPHPSYSRLQCWCGSFGDFHCVGSHLAAHQKS